MPKWIDDDDALQPVWFGFVLVALFFVIFLIVNSRMNDDPMVERGPVISPPVETIPLPTEPYLECDFENEVRWVLAEEIFDIPSGSVICVDVDDLIGDDARYEIVRK